LTFAPQQGVTPAPTPGLPDNTFTFAPVTDPPTTSPPFFFQPEAAGLGFACSQTVSCAVGLTCQLLLGSSTTNGVCINAPAGPTAAFSSACRACVNGVDFFCSPSNSASWDAQCLGKAASTCGSECSGEEEEVTQPPLLPLGPEDTTTPPAVQQPACMVCVNNNDAFCSASASVTWDPLCLGGITSTQCNTPCNQCRFCVQSDEACGGDVGQWNAGCKAKMVTAPCATACAGTANVGQVTPAIPTTPTIPTPTASPGNSGGNEGGNNGGPPSLLCLACVNAIDAFCDPTSQATWDAQCMQEMNLPECVAVC
jgi:hypothetical protein